MRRSFGFGAQPRRRDWTHFGFGAIAARGPMFEAGELRLVILSLLEEGPRHAYDLMKTVGGRSGSAQPVSAGSVYPAVQQLEQDGFIVSERSDRRRVYQLTETGHAELEKNAEKIKDIWKRAAGYDEWARWINPEMVMMWTPLGSLMQSTMRAVQDSRGDRSRLQRIDGILDRARKELNELSGK